MDKLRKLQAEKKKREAEARLQTKKEERGAKLQAENEEREAKFQAEKEERETKLQAEERLKIEEMMKKLARIQAQAGQQTEHYPTRPARERENSKFKINYRQER